MTDLPSEIASIFSTIHIRKETRMLKRLVEEKDSSPAAAARRREASLALKTLQWTLQTLAKGTAPIPPPSAEIAPPPPAAESKPAPAQVKWRLPAFAGFILPLDPEPKYNPEVHPSAINLLRELGFRSPVFHADPRPAYRHFLAIPPPGWHLDEDPLHLHWSIIRDGFGRPRAKVFAKPGASSLIFPAPVN